MNLNKNISFHKIFIPIGTLMLVFGFILGVYDFVQLKMDKSAFLGQAWLFLIVLGVIFFILGVIDRSISNRRNTLVEPKKGFIENIGFSLLFVVIIIGASLLLFIYELGANWR